MGWLTAPGVRKDSGVIDGTQSFMSIDPFGVANPNNVGMLRNDASLANYAQNGYGRNELVYACIRYRAESLPQSVLRVYSDASPIGPNPTGRGPALKNHRLRQLFANPNPVTDEFTFWELSSTYKDLAGTCFWLIVNGRDGLPSQAWPLRPDLVGALPVRTDQDPIGYIWVYRPDPEHRPEFFIPYRDAGSPNKRGESAFIMRIRYPNPNPTDPGWRYFGQPPLRPAARATSLDNAATDYVDRLLRHNALPTTIVESEQEITEVLHRRLAAMWRKSFSGNNIGMPVFLQKGMKVAQSALTLENLEFPDLRDISESRICSAFAVEPILVGARVGLMHNAYKDYHEARSSFWEESMSTEQARYVGPIRQHLLPLFSGVGRSLAVVDWDNSGVRALQESENQRWDRALNALSRAGITRNEFRQIIGLLPVAGGDKFLTPAGVLAEESGTVTGSPVPVSASIGLLAAEYGIELSVDELARLMARTGMEG
jgi:phage portal protein BeeE